MIRNISSVAALLCAACISRGILATATRTFNPATLLVGRAFDGYRVWTLSESTRAWGIVELKFYDNLDCTGPDNTDGEPVESRHHNADYVPKFAFDSDNSTYWLGKADDNDENWLGMEYDSPREVRCVSYMALYTTEDGYYDKYARSTFKIEGREISTGLWTEMIEVEDAKTTYEGEVHTFTLPVYSSSPSISTPPSMSPSKSMSPSTRFAPSSSPSLIPSAVPSKDPSETPSLIPTSSMEPSSDPSFDPSSAPSHTPSSAPSSSPSLNPVNAPSFIPSSSPTSAPTLSHAPSLSPCTLSVPWEGILTFYGMIPTCLLRECAGNCETDSDCEANLFCLKRGADGTNDSVPGCETFPYGQVNYCVARELQPSTMPSRISTTQPSSSPTKTRSTSPSVTQICPAWKQLGDALDTDLRSFAMSSDPLVVAIRQKRGNGSKREIAAYRYRPDNDNSMSWSLVTKPIDPTLNCIGQFCTELALSSDGSVVAVSDDEYRRKGRVQIFGLHPTDGWTKLGSAIDGENDKDKTGRSVTLSSDGTTVAVGAHHNSDNGFQAGYVRVFTYDIKKNEWIQRGADINGEKGDWAGHAVAIAAEGFIVAVGYSRGDANGDMSGHVRVFEFSVQDQRWDQRGRDLNGVAKCDQFGFKSIAMSKHGDVIAIAAEWHDINELKDVGHVLVFEYSTVDKDWEQRGPDIDGEKTLDFFGERMDISADGNAIVIGSIGSDVNGDDSGSVSVYDYNSLENLWEQRGKDMNGEREKQYWGSHVAMSADGTVVGINGYGSADDNKLKLFKWTTCSSPPSPMPSSIPNCDGDKNLLRLELNTDRFPKHTTWHVTDISNRTIVVGGTYKDMFTFHSETYCLDPGCYQFTIQDSSSDGICCNWFTGVGNYKLYLDSALIQKGGDFTSEETAIPIGSTCPSSAPSVIPSSRPSLQPTLSMQPSEYPSTVPSNQPSNVPTVSLMPSTAPSSQPTESCPVGTFVNSTNAEAKCDPCPPGSYQDEATYSDTCKECAAGSYQSLIGQTYCMQCGSGKFQEATGQAQCKECRAGGYCSVDKIGTCDGGFTPCPVGTYNKLTGATSVNFCLPCPTGTFSDNKGGLLQCSPCAYRLSSGQNSSVCSFCAEGFYLKTATVNSTELSKDPGAFCWTCPDNAKCDRNTTIKTLEGKNNTWRDSNFTATYYECKKSSGCKGSNSCADGYKGVRCELCASDNTFVDDISRECTDCRSLSRFAILPIIAISIAAMGITAYRTPRFKHIFVKYSNFYTRVGMQAKLKIFLSFYQIVTTLEPIYGVQMNSKFDPFFKTLNILDLGLLDLLSIPPECVGTMKFRLIVTALWPFIAALLLVSGIGLYTLIVPMRGYTRKDAIAKFWSRSVHVTIILFYIVIPVTCRSIFDAITCKSFDNSDVDKVSTSYLMADWSLKCGDADDEYKGVRKIFWVMFTIWPLAMPLACLGLLLHIRESVTSKSITPLAEASSFLWTDYRETMILWEFVDILRKILLTGIILFIDPLEGSDKILRLHIAILFCILYTGILALALPYRNKNDLYLAVTSNMILACCFVVGIMIHQCKESDDIYDTCHQTFGLNLNSYRATLFAVILTFSMIVIFTVLVLFLAMTEMNVPTIHLVSTNGPPRLDMASNCKHHLFVSHVWKTGQDKVRAIVRVIQLHFKGISIWLDVDSLKNIYDLENAVAETAHFVLFYSKGYFESRNCCRELMTAMKECKPITVLYEPDDHATEDMFAMKNECRQFWPDKASTDKVLEYIFAKDPIMWVSTGLGFTLESVKLLSCRLLASLPYYENSPRLLEKGLSIRNQVGPVEISTPLEILYCITNGAAYKVATKLEQECRGDASTRAINLSNPKLKVDGKATFMILYLTKDTFKDIEKSLECESVKRAIDESIPVVLVHEKNVREGGCAFSEIIALSPQELISEPYSLYANDLAISLFSSTQYESISLRQILSKMGDTCIKSEQS